MRGLQTTQTRWKHVMNIIVLFPFTNVYSGEFYEEVDYILGVYRIVQALKELVWGNKFSFSAL